MLSFGGAGLEIAGGHVGLREAVLLLIVLLAFYIGRVLWRMRHIAAPPERTVQQASAPAPAAALSAIEGERALAALQRKQEAAAKALAAAGDDEDVGL